MGSVQAQQAGHVVEQGHDIIISSTAMPPRCSRASQRSETGRPVTASKR
jgi:hypothetical protein